MHGARAASTSCVGDVRAPFSRSCASLIALASRRPAGPARARSDARRQDPPSRWTDKRVVPSVSSRRHCRRRERRRLRETHDTVAVIGDRRRQDRNAFFASPRWLAPSRYDSNGVQLRITARLRFVGRVSRRSFDARSSHLDNHDARPSSRRPLSHIAMRTTHPPNAVVRPSPAHAHRAAPAEGLTTRAPEAALLAPFTAVPQCASTSRPGAVVPRRKQWRWRASQAATRDRGGLGSCSYGTHRTCSAAVRPPARPRSSPRRSPACPGRASARSAVGADLITTPEPRAGDRRPARPRQGSARDR